MAALVTAPAGAGILARPWLDEPCPRRTRQAMLDANVGFSPGEVARLDGALGGTFERPLTTDRIARESPHRAMNGAEMDAEIEALCDRWLTDRRDQRDGGWSVSVTDLDGPAEALVPRDGAAFHLPRLPWSPPGDAPPERHSSLRVTGGGSLRAVDVFDPQTDRVLFNVKRSLPHLSERHSGAVVERLKRRALHLAFGLEHGIDTSLITRLDALHGLSITARATALRPRLPGFLHLLPEPLAAADTEGHAAVFRPAPETLDRRAAAALPVFALCHGRSASRNLLPEMAAAAGMDPADYALEVAGRYLAGWLVLAEAGGIVMTMPHAQNAFVLLDRQAQPFGLVLKDLRDMEHWPRYRRLSHRSIRLQGICRAYLAYEMAVHPLYFDTRPLRRVPLAEAMFNFAFFMLRNHVLRGLEASLTAPEAIARYSAGTAAMLAAAADGAGAEEVTQARRGGDDPLASIRALRSHLVRCLEDA